MLDYINEDQFQNFSKYKFNLHRRMLLNKEALEENSVVYCHTNYLDVLFSILRLSNKNHILITHGSDYSINEKRFSKKPDNIKKWFAQNAEYDHPDLIPIPTGLAPEYRKDLFDRVKFICTNINILRKNEKTVEKIYCGWNVDNNPEKRSNILDKLKYPYMWECGVTYEKYCDSMSRFAFVISPSGNGIDTHRTWEALYMGCIPIVIKHNIYKNYNDLPILQVNDYSEITRPLLDTFLTKVFNNEKLYMSYWKKSILEEFDKLKPWKY